MPSPKRLSAKQNQIGKKKSKPPIFNQSVRYQKKTSLLFFPLHIPYSLLPKKTYFLLVPPQRRFAVQLHFFFLSPINFFFRWLSRDSSLSFHLFIHFFFFFFIFFFTMCALFFFTTLRWGNLLAQHFFCIYFHFISCLCIHLTARYQNSLPFYFFFSVGRFCFSTYT